MNGVLLQLKNMDPTSRWALLIAAALTILYAVMRPAMRRKKDPLARPSSSNMLASQRAVERDMSNLLVELSEMARRITGQLDTRATKLELLIKEADQKIAALTSLLQSPSPPVLRPVHEPAHEDFSSPINPAHHAVYTLADQGRTPREIAAELGRPDGEVELILALRLAR